MSESKICRSCKELKPFAEFSKNSRRTHLDGCSTRCKICTRDYEKQKVKEYKSDSSGRICSMCRIYKEASEFHKNGGKRNGLCESCKVCRNISIVEKRHGLISGQLNQMKEAVDHKCEICLEETQLAVDHCHADLHVRGLLCINCNNGLGRFKDNITIMQNAIKYIKERNK